MQLTYLLAALPLAFATPVPEASPQNIPSIPGANPGETPPSGVQITGVSYAGSGCNAGTVASILSQDLSTLTLLYDSFVAQAGEGLNPTEYRKNCQLNVGLKYPQGWQYSVFKVDYRGYAYLQKGDKGVCKATYYFSGVTQQVSSALTLTGPYDDNYLKTDQFGVETTVWSPCGQNGYLNVNSEVRLTPIDTKKTALLTVGAPRFSGPWWEYPYKWWKGPGHHKKQKEIVDSTDLKFSQIHYLQWQKC